jgi:hypothetical protein
MLIAGGIGRYGSTGMARIPSAIAMSARHASTAILPAPARYQHFRSNPLIHLERRQHAMLIVTLAYSDVPHRTEHDVHARLEHELRLRGHVTRHRR